MSGPERAQRDEQIRRLRAEGRSPVAIAKRFNMGRATVYEVLHPAHRLVYNRRRREHWRELAG
jgi:hypothetical protein